MFDLILVDPQVKICEAWGAAFKNHARVEVVEGYFEKLPEFDCMVSAANSFGLMDGGVDLAISKFFGWDLQRRVQQHIVKAYFGEQPVGTSFIVETEHKKHPYVAHTPTMRVPLRITNTDNVYLAMFAMLRAVHQHNERNRSKKIEIVACPGLGTATGGLPPEEAARQMELAYRNFINPMTYISWSRASKRHKEIKFGGDVTW